MKEKTYSVNEKWQQNRCYKIKSVQSIHFGLFSISLFHSSFCPLAMIHFSDVSDGFKLIHQTRQFRLPHDQPRYQFLRNQQFLLRLHWIQNLRAASLTLKGPLLLSDSLNCVADYILLQKPAQWV